MTERHKERMTERKKDRKTERTERERDIVGGTQAVCWDVTTLK